MTSRDFVYWLQGFFELTDAKSVDEKQTDLIKRHLNMVFIHEIDPSMGDEQHQGKLTAVHSGEMQPQSSPPQDSMIPGILDYMIPGSGLTARC